MTTAAQGSKKSLHHPSSPIPTAYHYACGFGNGCKPGLEMTPPKYKVHISEKLPLGVPEVSV